MKEKVAYMFSFKGWHADPPKYFIVYAENEQQAREIGADLCMFNSEQSAKPENLTLCTYGL